MGRIRTLRTVVPAGAMVLLLAGVAACAGDTDEPEGEATGEDRLVLTVGYQPPLDQVEQREAFDRRVAEFEDLNPDIRIEPSTTVYDVETYQTMLAGGTLPIVMGAPLTEPPALIANGQIADITDAIEEVGLLDDLNPDLVDLVTGEDGRIYGVPTWAYALGLAYNRDIFEQAGLDPDAPPQTWEDLRDYAITITEETDAAGYGVLGSGNCGGWLLTAKIYSFGGLIVDESGTNAVFADTDHALDALQLIHDMKWVDGSLTEQNLYDCDSVQPDFAAGRMGMTLKGDYIPAVQQYGMDPEHYGFAGMPTWQGGDRATLTGGGISMVSPLATDEEKVAAVKYIEFMELRRYFDEEFAVSQAQAAQADGSIYEQPGIAPVDETQYRTFLDWIEPYNNVILANWEPSIVALNGTTMVPEPKFLGQQIYAELDTVVQTVLTDEGADLEQLIDDAQDRVNALLERG